MNCSMRFKTDDQINKTNCMSFKAVYLSDIEPSFTASRNSCANSYRVVTSLRKQMLNSSDKENRFQQLNSDVELQIFDGQVPLEITKIESGDDCNFTDYTRWATIPNLPDYTRWAPFVIRSHTLVAICSGNTITHTLKRRL